MYIEPRNPRVQGEWARFVSRWYKPSSFAKSGACVNFWYYMSGQDAGSLNIYIRHETKANMSGGNTHVRMIYFVSFS